MAMNKKEQAALDNARAALEHARRVYPALRWPTDPRPVPLPVPDDLAGYNGEYVSGYSAHGPHFSFGHPVMVSPGWCHNVSHGTGLVPHPHSGSQGKGSPLYATKLEALIASRFRHAEEFAEVLAKIDKAIEEERQNPTEAVGGIIRKER